MKPLLNLTATETKYLMDKSNKDQDLKKVQESLNSIKNQIVLSAKSGNGYCIVRNVPLDLAGILTERIESEGFVVEMEAYDSEHRKDLKLYVHWDKP